MKGNYKAYVGGKYEEMGELQFNYLKDDLHLLPEHKLLDIGCGSLRVGKWLIPYLDRGNYYGTEPHRWLINHALKYELTNDIIKEKHPSFEYDSSFNLSIFNVKFDYMLAQSIFSHATIDQVNACVTSAYDNLHDDGKFVFTYFSGYEDNERDEWSDSLVWYRKETIDQILDSNGFKYTYTEWYHPRNQVWVLAKK